MIAHGSAHVTVDIDVAYARDSDNLNRIVAAIKSHHPSLRGAQPGLPFIFDARTLHNTMNLTLSTDVGDVDLLSEPTGVESFDVLWDAAVPMEIFGVVVRVAALDHLI